MTKRFAQIISIVFHPLLIATLGMILLFNSGFYFGMLTHSAKQFVLLAIFLATCVLPLLSISLFALSPRFNIHMPESRDRVLPLLLTAVFYFSCSFIMNKVRVVPEFRLFILASDIVLITLAFISMRWKISLHMAGIGGLTGALFALSFKYGVNPVYPILIAIMVSGLIGTARLILQKHTLAQLIAGYLLAFSVLYLVIFFV